MPDGANLTTPPPGLTQRFREGWVSPLLRRILLVNALPLALLVVALLYLDQYRNGLLEAQIGALREQARVFAGINRFGFRQVDGRFRRLRGGGGFGFRRVGGEKGGR